MAGSVENLKKRIRFKTGKNYWQRALTRREYSIGLMEGAGVCAGLIAVFYSSLRALPVCAILLPLWMCWWSGEMQLKKRHQFEEQLKEALRMLAAALEAGHSLENAMIQTREEMVREGLGETIVGREFARMQQQLCVNQPVEEVWQAFGERSSQRDVVELAMVISAGKRAGGNLISVVKKSAIQIAQKMETEREIETVLASKKTELVIMMVMPIAILLYMRLVFGDMLSRLYHNALGVSVMSVALLLYLVAAYWGRRIVRVDL